MSEAFERRAECATPADLLALEAGSGGRFADVDATFGSLVVAGLRGASIVDATHDRSGDSVALLGLTHEQYDFVRKHFALAHQQSLGAWYLPEKVRIRAGRMNFPLKYRASPRFAASLIEGDAGTVKLASSPDALFAWALLEPFFDALYEPIKLRLTAGKSRDEHMKAWHRIDEMVAALELELETELATMRYGGGWSRLRAAEQTEARQRLLAALEVQATPALAARYRAFRLHALIDRYYQKSKKGRATRRQVLVKAEERTLSGFFDGDWLSFLEYIGEQPADSEEIVTSLPEPRFFAGGTERLDHVAATTSVSVDEIQLMLAALWNQDGAVSPIRVRTETLGFFWEAFEQLHARQAPGMPSLWGLTEQGALIDWGDERDETFSSGIYRRVLPAELLVGIRELWGTTMLPRWPGRIVTSLSPIDQMSAAFGPALKFWHGAALTAWFLCEGPSSRTDMVGLARYHAADLDALNALGCPIDSALFDDLIAVEARLPAPQPIYDDAGDGQGSRVSPSAGLAIRVQVSRGSRRDGFERLRDIITQHRRGWSERFLESYLRARWQSEFGEASRRYSRYVADEGKPPTAFQFAKTAAAANHWLGGNLAALYTVIGEKSPVRPERIQLVPSDVDALAKRVFVGLGGEPFKRYRVVQDRAEARRQHEDSTRYYRIRRLAEESPRYLQLQEALGQPPSKQQFGRSNFDFVANEIWGDVELGWQLYTESIARALEEMPAGERPPGEPLTRAVVAGSRQASVGKHGRKSRKAILDRLLGR